jgi:hypothetical protein
MSLEGSEAWAWPAHREPAMRGMSIIETMIDMNEVQVRTLE